jgi:GINS complex subunit 2
MALAGNSVNDRGDVDRRCGRELQEKPNVHLFKPQKKLLPSLLLLSTCSSLWLPLAMASKLNINQHFAEKEMISILPSFSLPKKIRLLNSTSVGPFTAQTPTQVPLWVALLLKKQGKARIIVPDWLSFESLLVMRKTEKVCFLSFIRKLLIDSIQGEKNLDIWV